MSSLLCRGPVLFMLISLMSLSVDARVTKDLYYDVYLDGEQIGYHKVSITPDANQKRVETKASFNVKFLIFNAYSYQHSADEIWRDNCLSKILAKTDDNGTQLFVNGQQQQDGFRIESTEGGAQVSGCVKSFAYWDPTLIQASHLLNTQNGQYTPVKTLKLGEEQISVAGRQVKASHYQIVSEDFVIDLWYSTRQEWLVLSTTTENGAKLRYERR